MRRLPKISVNIPAKPKSDVKPVLNSLKKIEYPPELIQIVIVEGNQIAKQRNQAIKRSSGEIIYLLDDDSEVRPDSFRIIIQEFKKKNVAAVGGPSLTKKDGNYLNFLIGCALETYFGAMRMRFRYSEQGQKTEGNEYQLIGANLALRKKTVEKIGLFNEKIVPNEETELLRRLKKVGYKLVYNKDLSIQRSQRKTLKDLAKQFFHYGVGRMKQILYNGTFEDLIFILPIAFVFYLTSLLLFHPIWSLIPLFLYLVLSLATSLKAASKYKKAFLILALPIIFLIIHISYASGIIYEILSQFLFKKDVKKHKNRFKISILSLRDVIRHSGDPD